MNIQDVRSKFENTDQWLKAPNGKRTNLTEQQWLVTRTTSFKNWFGDWQFSSNASEVLDSNGEPLVVYHGTRDTFTNFVTNPNGIHFGTQSQATMRSLRVLMPCFLNIRSLKEKVDNGDSNHWAKIVKRLSGLGENGIIYLNRYEGISLEEFEAARINHGISHDQLDRLSDHNFKKMVSASSYSYIVFHPTQIKSAVNNLNFSKQDHNIYL